MKNLNSHQTCLTTIVEGMVDMATRKKGVTDKRYGKYIKDIQNDVLHKKDPIPKTIDDVCHALVGWKSQYSRKYNRFLESNNGIAFATTTNKSSKKNKGKKKKVTCYKCKQEGHYSNKCPEEEEDKPEKGMFNKMSTSLLMKTQKNDKSDESSEEAEDSSDKEGFAFLQQELCAVFRKKRQYPKHGFA